MSLNQINRLFGKTNEDLIICQQKIDSWTKFLEDYKALDERLTTITDKTRHTVMVPVAGTDLAFMEGYIQHTNEILVLLGDNYFVERSAKQAREIVARRMNKCGQMLEELNKERTHLQNWLEFSKKMAQETQSEDFVEIIEEYDEQKEKEWREEHRRKLKEYKQSKKSENRDDPELFKRLEDLEIKESGTQKQELKSILKKTVKREESADSDKSVSFDEPIGCDERRMPLVSVIDEEENIVTNDQSNESPFRNEVIERDIESELLSGESVSTVEVKSSPKIVSRFKANRMKK